ncbi:MAG: DUF493 domain-containing protein [Succinivibrionaceae bacterium]|nr:DUF493 domain-containing protein [Succinivibrionaceae bacterium]
MTSIKKDPTFGELLEFPCDFSLRIIGADSDETERDILRTVREKFALEPIVPVTRARSSKKTYAAFRLSLRVESEKQLRSLYAELGKISGVKYVL